MPHTGGLLCGDDFRPFCEIELCAARIASGFLSMDIGAGDCVAILMRNDAPFIAISYGVMKVGAYAVPINWHFKGEEIAYILEDCGAKALFGHADLLDDILAFLPAGLPVFRVPMPDIIRESYGLPVPPARREAEGALHEMPSSHIDYHTWCEAFAPCDAPVRPAPMSMIYTSGTTGNPKGVRRNTPDPAVARKLDQIRATVYGLKPGIRACLPGPLYHSAPNSFGLRAGKIADLLVLMARFDPEALLRLIEKERIDTLFMVPTMFTRLLKLPEHIRTRYDVSSLSHVIHAAAPCPADVKAAMITWWGPVIFEFYGGTETGPVSFASSADALQKPGTVGRASPGAQIRILDDHDQILPTGQMGEIYSHLDAYPDFTYHNNAQKRVEVERDGFITCGDIGYLDGDGYLFISDRKRDMVISGGVNIYPAEIEAVLHSIPSVHDCAVFGIPDPDFGEALMAVVELQDGSTLTPDAIHAYLSTRLAKYKVPNVIEIRHDLPREDSGKIFKRRLRDPYWLAAGRTI